MATIQVADKPTLDAVKTAVDSIKSNNYSSVVPINIEVSGLPLDVYHLIYKATGSGKIIINRFSVTQYGYGSVNRKAYISIDGGEKIELRDAVGATATFVNGGLNEICFKKSIEFFMRGSSSNAADTIGAVLTGALFMQ